MARDPPGHHGHHQQRLEQDERPLVLVVRPLLHGGSISKRFRTVTWSGSTLSLPLFLSDHASARALILGFPAPLMGADVLSLLPNLGVVVTTSAGTDHIDLAECGRRGILVANAGGVFSIDTAEYAVGLLIDVMRRVSAGDRCMRRGMWTEFPLGAKLGGKRVGIVGLGKIGSEIAKRLEAFGCIISYHSRQTKPSLPYPHFSTARDLAMESDVLVVCCSLNSETHHIVDMDVMRALGNDGVVINIGRGPLVDEKELVQRLLRGEIRGAGLDVFEDEPRVPEELFGMDNVVLSPHRAVFTEEGVREVDELAAANLEAFFSDRPLVSPVPVV